VGIAHEGRLCDGLGLTRSSDMGGGVGESSMCDRSMGAMAVAIEEDSDQVDIRLASDWAEIILTCNCIIIHR
jgi:hypothetical protein